MIPPIQGTLRLYARNLLADTLPWITRIALGLAAGFFLALSALHFIDPHGLTKLINDLHHHLTH